jgi:hypothetical protein
MKWELKAAISTSCLQGVSTFPPALEKNWPTTHLTHVLAKDDLPYPIIQNLSAIYLSKL